MDILSEKHQATISLKPESADACVDWRMLFAPVRHELQRVDDILKSELVNADPFVDEMLQHARSLGGKRLRPALLLLVAKSLGGITDEHLTLAVVIEMIHAATLVHDDILDGASQRRHKPTLNSIWGNESSVLVGDYLFSRSFFLASSLQTTHACREIGKATTIVCEGEMRQIGSCANFSLGEDEYLKIIEAKTAALCASATYLAACYAKPVGGAVNEDKPTNGKTSNRHASNSQIGKTHSLSDRTEEFREYGRLLGIAFQITDDVLDIVGSENCVGKSLGTDLQQLKPTLPLIHLLQSLELSERDRVIHALERNQAGIFDEIRDAMFARGSIEYAIQRAEDHADAARNIVRDLHGNEATVALQRIPKFVVQRQR